MHELGPMKSYLHLPITRKCIAIKWPSMIKPVQTTRPKFSPATASKYRSMDPYTGVKYLIKTSLKILKWCEHNWTKNIYIYISNYNKYICATLGTSRDATSWPSGASKINHYQSTHNDHLSCHVTFEDVMKEIRHLRSHCSTVVDQIPVKFVTFVSEHIAGALIHY